MIKNANWSEKLFNGIVYGIVSVIVLICLYPFLNVLAFSFSSNSAILSGEVTIFPVEMRFDAYKQILGRSAIWKSMQVSVIITVIGSFFGLVLTTCAAYALSKEHLLGRKFMTVLIIFTMYFSGGIIPRFLVIKELGLLDTIWSLILPTVMTAYNFIVMRTFFKNIPSSLEEAAIIDGAGQFSVLTRIIIPLSTPIMATIGLFYAVDIWNNYFNAMMYITNSTLYPLQMRLRQIIFVDASTQMLDSFGTIIMPEAIKAAAIIVATLPILLVYPWLQKYFAKGVMVGGVKG